MPQLSGRNLDQAAPGDRQGRVASGRTVSARRLHRDEHEPPGRARGRVLQQARHVRAMDQGRQGRDQMDAAVVPDVRGQRRASPASCARLQSRQFPAHASDAGADQRLVADELERKADQDRREGGEPWPLYRLPDGRGRHPTANVPGDSAAHRGIAAAATTSASVSRSIVMRSCVQQQRRETCAQMPGNWPNQPPSSTVRAARCWSPPAPRNCLHKTRKGANIHASSGAIWGILVQRIRRHYKHAAMRSFVLRFPIVFYLPYVLLFALLPSNFGHLRREGSNSPPYLTGCYIILLIYACAYLVLLQSVTRIHLADVLLCNIPSIFLSLAIVRAGGRILLPI